VSNDALVLMGRITAQGTSNGVNQLPLWLQEIQAIAAVATTVGVLIAVYVAVIREPRKAAEERRRHKARMDALHRARRKRLAAQARKVVPTCVRTPMFGGSCWTVRIDNASNAVTTILAVDVKAIYLNGFEVPDGCRQASNAMPLDQAFDRSIPAALSESLELDSGLQQPPFGEITSAAAAQPRSSRLPQAFKQQAFRDALVGHFATDWQRTLPPNQHTLMTYTTTKPDYTLRVTIDYEDEAGYQWRRTDSSSPKRIG
jgi:hypothetical protein